MTLRLALAAAACALALPNLAFAASAAENKQTVIDFMNMVFVQKKVREGFEKYVGPQYIQHNPIAPDGAEHAVNALEPFLKASTEYSYEIKRVIADGDLVAVHGHARMNAADRGNAIVDIFRLENGKVVEHWDVIQPVPETSANPHPMF